jgi:hypothetical protein
MRIEGQVGSGVPVKAGQAMIPTQCFCGAKFSNPSKAVKHLEKHANRTNNGV